MVGGPSITRNVELITRDGVWRQQIEVEESMESCLECKGGEHQNGLCPTKDKGKDSLEVTFSKLIVENEG